MLDASLMDTPPITSTLPVPSSNGVPYPFRAAVVRGKHSQAINTLRIPGVIVRRGVFAFKRVWTEFQCLFMELAFDFEVAIGVSLPSFERKTPDAVNCFPHGICVFPRRVPLRCKIADGSDGASFTAAPEIVEAHGSDRPA